MQNESLMFASQLKEIYSVQDKIAPLIEGLDEIPQYNMKDYYVKLQIIIQEDEDKKHSNYESISGRKEEIEISKLFGQPNNDASAKIPSKLLVLGGAGVGKSTLLQYMAYKWSKEEIWKNKFDYVYRVMLKTLLNDEWKEDYEKKELRESKLKCLVHYNLVRNLAPKKVKKLGLESIYWPEKKEKILLLLDGYDEVAHLKDNNDYQEVEDELFEHQNIIFTSRPNAVDNEMKAKFDLRIINTGLDNEGIEQYFTQYFKNDPKKGEELRKFLNINALIRDICKIPVNIAMLCYIWSSFESSDNLQEISRVSQLYSEVVSHLGYRYFAKKWKGSKSEGLKLKDKIQNGEFALDELQVLAHTAYKGMTGGGIEVSEKDRVESLIIKGASLKGGKKDVHDEQGISIQSSINHLAKKKQIKDDAANKVTIGQVYKYGLLKPEKALIAEANRKENDTELQEQDYSFIHLTFQEYLTAYYLKQRLQNGSDQEKNETCNFLAEYRNQPRYLMTLKFLAGLMTSSSQGDETARMVEMFWEAMTCNVDGIIELGIETKVSLLMHLLSQARIKGELDPRIPNKEQIVNLIDAVVLADILNWRIQLKESDYMSDNIKEGILRALNNEDKDNLKWHERMINKIEEKSSPELKSALKSLVKSEDEKKNALENDRKEAQAIEMIEDFILRFSSEEQQSIILNLIETIKKPKLEKWQKIKQTLYTLAKLIPQSTLTSEGQKELLDSLFEFIGNSSLKEAANHLAIKLISLSENKDELANQTVEKIINKIGSSDEDVISHAYEFFILIAPIIEEPKAIIQAVDNAVFLFDQGKFSFLSIDIFFASFAIKAKSDLITSHILSNLRKLDEKCKENSLDWFIRDISSSGDQRLIHQVFEHSISFLRSPDSSMIYKGLEYASNLATKIEDKRLFESVFTSVIPVLGNEDEYVKKIGGQFLKEFCSKANTPVDNALVANVFDQIMPYLNKYDETGLEMVRSLELILKFTTDKILAKEIIEKSTDLINIENDVAKEMGLNILAGVAKAIKDKEIAILVLDMTFALLFEEKAWVREASDKIMTNVLNTMQNSELSTMILEKLINVIMNEENFENKKVALLHCTLVLEGPEKEKTLIHLYNVILNVLSNENKELRVAAIKAVAQLLTKWPEHSIPTSIVDNLLESLSDEDRNVKAAALNTISLLKVQDQGGLVVGVLNKALSFVAPDWNLSGVLKKLSERIEDKEVATRTFEKIMEIFPTKRGDVKQAALIAASIVYSYVEKDNISSKAVDRIEEFMLGDDAACKIAKKMIKAGEQKLLKKLINTMQNFEELDMLKKTNIFKLSLKIEWKSEQKQFAIEFLSKIIYFISADNYSLKLAARRTFGNVIKIFPDQKLALKGLDSIRNELKTSHYHQDSAAEIVKSVEDRKKVIPLLDELIERGGVDIASSIVSIFNNDDSDLAVYVFEKNMLKANKADAYREIEIQVAIVASFLLPFKEYMQSVFRHPNSTLRNNSGEQIISVFEEKLLKKISLMEQIIKPNIKLDVVTLEKELFNGKMEPEVKNELKAALALYSQNPLAENLDKIKHFLLSQLNQIGNKKSYQLIEIALSLLAYDEESGINKDIARQVINLEIKYLDEEGLRWIANNLDSLIGLSTETKSFCKKLCHKMLEDFEITDAEKELLIKFVSIGLTISISRTGDIIFEGKRYTIQTKNAGPLLEELARAVVDQNRDLLALQYKEHKPIFPKKYNGGMKQATADIEEMCSIVDRTNQLSSDVWFLTKLESQGQEIVLLEQRSAIGDHLIYLPNEKKLIRTNPQDINKERERIFGKYIIGKRYQGSCSTLDFSQGSEIITKEKLPEMKKVTTNTYFQQELLGLGNSDRINSIQSELDKKLSDYNKVLESRLKDANLSPEDAEKVKEYYHAFVGTFASAYTSALVINSGQVQLHAGDSRATVLSTLVSFAPFVGDTLSSVITSFSEFVKSREMIKNARKMKDIAVDAVALSQLIGEVACKIVMDKNKQQEIFTVNEEEMHKVAGSLLEKISKVCNLVGEKIDDFLYTKKFKTAPAKLGNNDANKLIEQWVQDKIQLQNIQAQFINITTKNNTGEEKGVVPSDTQKGEQVDTKRSNCCAMF